MNIKNTFESALKQSIMAILLVDLWLIFFLVAAILGGKIYNATKDKSNNCTKPTSVLATEKEPTNVGILSIRA